MKKNWKMIAGEENKHLRYLLISAKTPSDMEGLIKGFPQFFSEDDGSSLIGFEWKELCRLMVEAEDTKKRIQILKDLGVCFQLISFYGSKRGQTEGVSYSSGSYDVPSGGSGSNFYVTTKKTGEILQFQGAPWRILFHNFQAGSPYDYAYHSLFLVPEEALGEGCKVKKPLEGEGGKNEVRRGK